jgi:thioesterase domain-containing protein/acyl carrier protein
MSEDQKRDLLKRLLREKITARAAADVRLTTAQLRLWELEKYKASPNIHVFAIAYYLDGPLNPDLIGRAMAVVAARHFGLHARMVENDEGPYLESVEPPLLERSEETGDDGKLETRLRAEAANPIDPLAGPAWRCVLIRRSAQQHVLLFCFHHIIADRWSVGVLISELGRAYAALQQGEDISGPPSASAKSESPDDRSGLEYWKNLFSATPQSLHLPLTRDAEGFGGYAGDCLEEKIDIPTVRALKDLATSESTTLFPVLLAAFGMLLRAHTGQTDLLICTPMSGRTRSATRDAIGYFNNIVPLRLDLGGDPTFQELIRSVSVQARAAFEHQNVPFQTIAALPELEGVRTTRCLFTVQNIPGLELELPGITSRYKDIPNGTANFDLSLFAEEKKGTLHVVAHYKTDHFSLEAATELKDRFLACLRYIAQRSAFRLSEFLAEKGSEWAALDVAARRPDTPNPAAPANMIEQRIVEMWRSLFPKHNPSELHSESHFFDLGGDSMLAAKLFARIEKEFGAELPLATLLEAPTPRQLAQRMSDKDWAAPWMSLVPLRAAGSRPPLFLLPGGGGNMLSFRQIANHLGNDQPIYCLRAQGLKRGEEALTSVEEMAAEYINVIQHVHPRGPYMLVGHSLGAVVAYEMAQRLTQMGESVPLVGVFDHPGPDIHLRASDWLRFNLMSIANLSNPERVEFIWRGLRWKVRMRLVALRLQKSPAASRNPSGRSSIDVLEGSIRALRNYKIRPFPGRIALFRAKYAPAKIRSDRFGGWGGAALQGVDVFEVPGTHMSMLAEPHVQALGAALGRCIEDIVAKNSFQSLPASTDSASVR